MATFVFFSACTCWRTFPRPSYRGFCDCDNVATLGTSVWLGWSLLLPRGDGASSVDATVVAQMPFQPAMRLRCGGRGCQVSGGLSSEKSPGSLQSEGTPHPSPSKARSHAHASRHGDSEVVGANTT